jgi:hypothetical protein
VGHPRERGDSAIVGAVTPDMARARAPAPDRPRRRDDPAGQPAGRYRPVRAGLPAATAVLIGLCAAGSGCDETNSPQIDPFPIPITTELGPILLGAVTTDSADPVPALVDTLSPMSTMDTLETPATEIPAPRRRRTTLTLLSACPGPDPVSGCPPDQPPVPRARYYSIAVIDVHSCQDPASVCQVGVAGRTAAYRAIVGGDLLARTAVRIDLRDPLAPQMVLFPDIAGNNAEHCAAGETVVPIDLAGGGTVLLEGGEVGFSGTRLPINACLDFAPDRPGAPSGTNALLLLATGLGPSVLSESAYFRYFLGNSAFCDAQPEQCDGSPGAISVPPPYSELPVVEFDLPSGRTEARLVTLTRVALVGNGTADRSACDERRAVQLMTDAGQCSSGDDCPCAPGRTTCAAAAAAELSPAVGITFAVLADTHPLLQSLRGELRPGQAEVDGLLGLDALSALRIDIDYPAQRLLMTCAAASGGDVDPPSETAVCRAYTQVSNPQGTSRADRCVPP